MFGNLIRRIVMQPTSLCNLDCSYCYLAHRQENKKMSPLICSAVAKGIKEDSGNIHITWHGGEPLTCGIRHFESLLRPFASLRSAGRVTHTIQTNATLINDEWCSFFKEHEINVGISIDGPKWANFKRVGWNSKESYSRIIRGIDLLKENQIPFMAICVVGDWSLSKPRELYKFFRKLGCNEVGFNIEEKVGIHDSSAPDDGELIKDFWKELFIAWRENPTISIREFSSVLMWMDTLLENEKSTDVPRELFPSVAYDGNVVLLSPELLDAPSEYYSNFTAGNVLAQSLGSIVASGKKLEYVRDFMKGIQECSESCEYFDYCMGGQASNKFFELGSMNGTVTTHCRNMEQRLIDAVLSVV